MGTMGPLVIILRGYIHSLVLKAVLMWKNLPHNKLNTLCSTGDSGLSRLPVPLRVFLWSKTGISVGRKWLLARFYNPYLISKTFRFTYIVFHVFYVAIVPDYSSDNIQL